MTCVPRNFWGFIFCPWVKVAFLGELQEKSRPSCFITVKFSEVWRGKLLTGMKLLLVYGKQRERETETEIERERRKRERYLSWHGTFLL
jgi:hypothetical protein